MEHVYIDKESFIEDLKDAFKDEGWELDSSSEYDLIAYMGDITILIVDITPDKITYDVGYSVSGEATPASQAALLEALYLASHMGYDYISFKTGNDWYDAGPKHNEEDLPLSHGVFIIDGRSTNEQFPNDFPVESLPYMFESVGEEHIYDVQVNELAELVDTAEDDSIGIL